MSQKKAILSPLPGVFYRKPSPEEAEFFKEGDAVKAGDTVGLIEVMKNFYEVKAEEDGIIEKFVVDNEGIVDAGQELLVLK
ncbi:acetyl-CoA carboxylase [Brevibacillus massiliensis]|uniref:acetyl-CoA carboxylase n=1 Tax=Brevibacillus massiliensis TaxID=1118054 RepID=UPI0004752A6E|nr:acetyl-CoA carboxylase [Brevibacillus massiliensis]